MAQYFHNFNLDAVASGLPSGVVAGTAWNGDGTFDVVAVAGENALRRQSSNSGHPPELVTLSGVGSVSGVTEVYTRIRMGSTSNWRGGPTFFASTSAIDGYIAAFFGGDTIGRLVLAAGVKTYTSGVALTWTADTWYRVIARMSSGTLTMWVYADGVDALIPGTSSHLATFSASGLSDYTTGEVGVSAVRAFGDFFIAQMGIGTSGDAAPQIAAPAGPAIDTVTPSTLGRYTQSLAIAGTDFDATGSVKICQTDDVDDVNGVTQNIDARSDTSITTNGAKLPAGTATGDTLYLFVIDSESASNAAGYALTVTWPAAVPPFTSPRIG